MDFGILIEVWASRGVVERSHVLHGFLIVVVRVTLLFRLSTFDLRSYLLFFPLLSAHSTESEQTDDSLIMFMNQTLFFSLLSSLFSLLHKLWVLYTSPRSGCYSK